jgi:anhydro-N-acetylmuramic acid kinase
MPAALYIGLMSGTSMDGIDGVVMDLAPGARLQVLAHVHRPFEPSLRASLFQLNESGPDELHHAALAGNALSLAYAEVVTALLHSTAREPDAICAIGAHGQTVRHRPGEFDRTGYTIQLLNGALLAERTGIDVVCDFRSRDVAAGGQGAPLVPAFHRAAFATPVLERAVLNIGGIANLSLLHADGQTSGHDCGPGNVLLDAWCSEHLGLPYDKDGAWAAQGCANEAFLVQLLRDPYLERLPPKSTGRDLFNRPWLEAQLQSARVAGITMRPVDVQATLTRFTATVAANDLHMLMPGLNQLLVCGGGALNKCLMAELAAALPGAQVSTINLVCDIDPMHVEAAAFAWLAHAFTTRQPGNCTEVTGAAGARVLGALHPG